VHRALERALPLDFDDWPLGRQRYSLLCNERGGIEDDLMVTRLANEVRLVVNASTKEKDLALLRRLCPSLSFEPLDHALIALQGPHAERTLAALAPSASSPGRAIPAKTAMRSPCRRRTPSVSRERSSPRPA
jgi:aminomethyltransferase